MAGPVQTTHPAPVKDKKFAEVECVRDLDAQRSRVDDGLLPDILEPRKSRSHIDGWRKGVYSGISATALVLLLNVSIIAYVRAHYASDSGSSQLTSGDCSRVNRVKTGTHLVINLLATGLLSASNYAMQVLISPTRGEVDRAHAKRKWLDIGLPSLRNIPMISKWRLLLWFGLVMSSLPLHLVYNSVIFSTFNAYDYHVLVVSPEFLDGAPYDLAALPYLFNSSGGNNLPNDPTTTAVADGIRADIGSFERLDKVDCLAAYGRPFMTTRSDIVVVTTAHNSTDSVGLLPLGSVRPLKAATGVYMGYLTPWRRHGHYCLSRPMPSVCSINFYSSIMVVVICCNIAKLVLLIGTLAVVDGTSLVTIGDAIASFLNRADTHTIGFCLMGRRNAKAWQVSTTPTPRICIAERRRWIRTIGGGRIALSFIFVAAGLITIAILLRQVIVQLEPPGGALPSMSSIAALGFGNVQSQYYWTGGPDSLLGNILITNLPQLVFSILYLVYNGLYTTMLIAHEWAQYGRRALPLRVTRPQGQQRSTYFLQLPLLYAMPLMVVSILSHWVISQSFYIMSVRFSDMDGTVDDTSRYAAGYSPLAIILALILTGVLILVFLMVSLRRLPDNKIPFAGCCSAAISPACHSDSDANEAVSWGVIRRDMGQDVKAHDGVEVGHCAFGQSVLGEPAVGQSYM
ncbi:hypothetical protein ANO11243_085180 [Dothideomycetidae sp. 11243]|nr:hypothetical protein ANO11243_085180 [fungal sp. No.11243]